MKKDIEFWTLLKIILLLPFIIIYSIIGGLLWGTLDNIKHFYITEFKYNYFYIFEQEKHMYKKCLKYILEHKWIVFKLCIKKGKFIHALTHDLSKLYPDEFFAISRKYFSDRTSPGIDKSYDLAWLLHKNRNKHHWEYWIDEHGKPIPMPKRYVEQMLIDWEAMSIKFKDTPEEFYDKTKNKMILHEDSITWIERLFIRRKYHTHI